MKHVLDTLLEELPELVYICDLETNELLYVNAACRSAFDIDDLRGKRCYELLQGLDEPCEFCSSNQPSFDRFCAQEHTNPLTGRHYVVHKKLVQWEGKDSRFSIAFDVTDRERDRERLEHIAQAGKAAVECIKLLSANADVLQATDEAIAYMGAFLEADRMAVTMIEEDKLRVTNEWCIPGTSSRAERLCGPGLGRSEQWGHLFETQESYLLGDVSELAERDPVFGEAFAQAGVERLVVVPLKVDGEMHGFLNADNLPLERLQDAILPLLAFSYFMTTTVKRDSERRRIEQLTWGDPLTGVASRTAFYRDFSKGKLERIGMVEAGADGINSINAREGRDAGDKLLVRISDALVEAFGKEKVYRMGGDEFIAVFENTDEAAFVASVLDLSRKFDARGAPVSLGYAWKEACLDAGDLLVEADMKMKRAKSARACVRERGAAYSGVLLRPGGAAEAVRNGDLTVHLQPQFSPDGRHLLGIESLVRYVDPITHEIVPPDSFIPALEDMGEIGVIDFYVLDQACDFVESWRARGLVDDGLPVAVNFSRRTVEAPHFVDRLVSIIEERGIPPIVVEVEITESVREIDPQGLLRVVGALREAGFLVAIDDFGVENANMSLFASMRFDALKLDGSLITGIENDEWKASIVGAVIKLCNDLHIDSIAEYVENEQQLACLRAMGCTRVQGYLLGKPLSLDEFEHVHLVH